MQWRARVSKAGPQGLMISQFNHVSSQKFIGVLFATGQKYQVIYRKCIRSCYVYILSHFFLWLCNQLGSSSLCPSPLSKLLPATVRKWGIYSDQHLYKILYLLSTLVKFNVVCQLVLQYLYSAAGDTKTGRLNKRPKVTLKINGRAEINSNCTLGLVTEHSINKSARLNLSPLKGRGAYQIPGKLRSLFLNKQSVRLRLKKKSITILFNRSSAVWASIQSIRSFF